MILRFFNEKHIIVQVVIIVAFFAAMIFRSVDLQPPQSFGPLYESIYLLLLGHPVLIFISYASLIVLEGLLLQVIVLKYNLVTRNNLIVVFIWLILAFSNPALANINPVLFATVLITWAVYKLFAIPEEENTLAKLFSVGFIISFASLIYGSVFYYLIFLIVSLFILSLVNIREIMVSIISFFLPYLYILSYSFVMDKDMVILGKVNFSLENISFFSSGPLFWISISLTILIALLSLVSFLNLITNLFSKLIQFRNHTTVLFVLFFVGFILQFLSGPWWFVHPYLIFIPLAILISIYLSEQKRTRYLDLALFIILFLEIIQLYYLNHA